MRSFILSSIIALASLAASADTLYFTGTDNLVDDGGQFAAYLNTPSDALTVYCVDFRNELLSPEVVNVSTPLNAADIADTRYGTTATSAFSFFSTGPGKLSALDRYVQAAWLISQYNFTSGVTLGDDQIQNAIWTLLTVDGVGGFPFGDAAGTGAWLAAAAAWENGESASALTAFEGDVRIYTSTDVAGLSGYDGRYTAGGQEMIALVPEPGAAWMAISGLALILCARSRRNVRQ